MSKPFHIALVTTASTSKSHSQPTRVYSPEVGDRRVVGGVSQVCGHNDGEEEGIRGEKTLLSIMHAS